MRLRIGACLLFGLWACKTDEGARKTEAENLKPVGASITPPSEVAVEVLDLPPAPALPVVKGLPKVQDSVDNPTTPEKVELGRLLFFDKRLSKDGSMSCESCHHIAQGYTSGQALDSKVGGALNKRNAPAVTNLGYHTFYYWDGRMPTLEAVSNAAWKGQLGADPAAVASALHAVPKYRAHFQRAFSKAATPENVPMALAAFFRALSTHNSAWDKFQAQEPGALSTDAQAGYKVFLKAQCSTCHVPPLFSDFAFHNLGWNAQANPDAGRKDATKLEEDAGKFKTPSLRDVALTGPYFHDGAAKTLEEAIDFMAAGPGKNSKLDPNWKAAKLSSKEKKQLKAFLESLTGEWTYSEPPILP